MCAKLKNICLYVFIFSMKFMNVCERCPLKISFIVNLFIYIYILRIGKTFSYKFAFKLFSQTAKKKLL